MNNYHAFTDNGTRVQILDSPADGNNFITQTAIVTSPNGVQSYCPAANKTRELKVRFAIGYADDMTAILTLTDDNTVAARFILRGDYREMYKTITDGSEFAKMKGGIPGFYGECLRLFSQHKAEMVKVLEVDADFSFDETFESEAYISVSFPEYQDETALVVPGMDTIGVSFLTLYGDHSKDYASIMNGKECPYGDCLKYFREHLHDGGKFEFGSVYSILSVKNYSFDEWF